MKTMKKTMALVLTFVLALALAAPAWAAPLTEVDAGTAKSITITTPSTAQATDEFTYTVYKIFDATSDGESAGISYKATAGTVIEATDQLSKFEADAQGNVRYYTRAATTDEYAINTSDTQLSDGMIAALAAYQGKTEVGTVSITGTSASKTVDVGSYGYFYITTTSGTVVTIDSTNPSASVNDKNTLPTMDKDIASVTSANGGNHATGADNENNETATANIGDTVNYSVTINAKKGADSYVYHDILSAGLTLVTGTEPTITVNPAVNSKTTLVKDTDYTLTKFANNETNGTADNITITFNQANFLDKITGDTTITITYSAIVNENAVIAGANKNTGTLDYGHKSDGTPNTTPPDEPEVYTYQFQLVKDNSSKKVLTGAEFKLYQEEACTNEIALVKVADGQYRVATAAEKAASGFTAAIIEAGTPEIQGLGNGTYYLKETKAPESYNLLADPVAVTISSANNDATLNGDTYTSGGVEVVNQQGTELPSTGGIGTKIFYTMGAVLVIGAGVVLVSRKRAGE